MEKFENKLDPIKKSERKEKTGEPTIEMGQYKDELESAEITKKATIGLITSNRNTALLSTSF